MTWSTPRDLMNRVDSARFAELNGRELRPVPSTTTSPAMMIQGDSFSITKATTRALLFLRRNLENRAPRPDVSREGGFVYCQVTEFLLDQPHEVCAIS